jgi:hypothetical protein
VEARRPADAGLDAIAGLRSHTHGTSSCGTRETHRHGCKNPPRQRLAREVTQEEGDVGGALGEAAHEIGEPITAEGDVHADAVTVGN